MNNTKTNNYIRPLGFNKKGSNYLKQIKNKLNYPLISNLSNNKDLLELEFKVNSIYSLKNRYNFNDELNKIIQKK